MVVRTREITRLLLMEDLGCSVCIVLRVLASPEGAEGEGAEEPDAARVGIPRTKSWRSDSNRSRPMPSAMSARLDRVQARKVRSLAR